MITRRRILVTAAAGLGTLALPIANAISAPPENRSSSRPALFLLDDQIDIGQEAVRAMAADNILVRRFSGDAADAWLNVVEPLWRHRPAAIAGVTRGGPFFCLEHLGRAYGMACTFKRLHVEIPPLGLHRLRWAQAMLTPLTRDDDSLPRATPLLARLSDQTHYVGVSWLLRPVRL